MKLIPESSRLAAASLAGFALFLSLPSGAGAADDAGYESVPAVEAQTRLGLRAKGPSYEVLSPVGSDGFLDTYSLRSDFGEFQVEGGAMLAIRLKEVEALAELSKLSKTKVFTDAVTAGVKNSTLGQLETLEAFADRPVETIKGVPQGVKRAWKKFSGAATETWSDVKETTSGDDSGKGDATPGVTAKTVDAGKKYASRYFGTSAAQRRWAQKLGVDPYTSNEILQKQMKAVAKVDAAGRFGVRFAGIPSIPGLGYVRDLNKLVWEVDALELRQRNQAFLSGLGTKPDMLGRFLDNQHLSPTLQTLISESLREIEGVAERWRFIEQAGTIDSEPAAWAFAGGLRLLLDSHKTRQPLAAALPGVAAPLARERDGTALAGVAVDRLYWTETLANGVDRFAKLKAAGGKLAFAFAGDPSSRARQELDRRGVALVEGLSTKAAPAAPAPEAAKP